MGAKNKAILRMIVDVSQLDFDDDLFFLLDIFSTPPHLTPSTSCGEYISSFWP